MEPFENLFELPALHRALQGALGTHINKKHDSIVEICQNIQNIVAQQHGAQNWSMYEDVGVSIFSLLCNFSKFERGQLFEHEDTLMNTALMLYNVLPAERFGTDHLIQLIQYATVAATPNTVRNTLICSMVQGPTDHWDLLNADFDYYFGDLETKLIAANPIYSKNPTPLTSLFFKKMIEVSQSRQKNHKLAHETLHLLAHNLLCDDRLKFYPDTFMRLDLTVVIRTAIDAKKHNSPRALEHLDPMVDEDHFHQWFPHDDSATHTLAEHYPRLRSFLEKRTLERHLSNPTPFQQKRQKI